MGFFSKLFGKKKEEAPREAVDTIVRFVRLVMSQYGEEHFQGETQAAQILMVYSFGAVHAMMVKNKMSQEQAHEVCIEVFMEAFGLKFNDAAFKTGAVIGAAGDETSHLNRTIHRGIDGFLHWQKNGDKGAADDFKDVMPHFEESEEPALSTEGKVKVFLNPLVMLLAGSERQKGRPLTREEVLAVRDAALYDMMTPKEARDFYAHVDANAPVHRMNPDRVWEEWQEIRDQVRLE